MSVCPPLEHLYLYHQAHHHQCLSSGNRCLAPSYQLIVRLHTDHPLTCCSHLPYSRPNRPQRPCRSYSKDAHNRRSPRIRHPLCRVQAIDPRSAWASHRFLHRHQACLSRSPILTAPFRMKLSGSAAVEGAGAGRSLRNLLPALSHAHSNGHSASVGARRGKGAGAQSARRCPIRKELAED